MKILIADKFPGDHMERLRSAGHECRYEPDTGPDELASAVSDAHVLVVRSTKVMAPVIEGAESLQMIVRAGSGVNTIAVNEAAAVGIQVSNVPGRNAIAVAELVMGLMISIDRGIPDAVAEIRAGRWDKKRFAAGAGLFGRTLGIIGLGNIGLALAERARAFGMTVLGVAKPRLPRVDARIAEASIELVADRATLLGRSDFVSIHIPYEGEAVVDADFLDLMQPGSILINTSRGDMIDEEALIGAMDAKGIRAGLDVYRGEPSEARGEFHSKLAQHPNVYGTHHIGASTRQAQTAVADEVVAIIEAFERGEARNQVA